MHACTSSACRRQVFVLTRAVSCLGVAGCGVCVAVAGCPPLLWVLSSALIDCWVTRSLSSDFLFIYFLCFFSKTSRAYEPKIDCRKRPACLCVCVCVQKETRRRCRTLLAGVKMEGTYKMIQRSEPGRGRRAGQCVSGPEFMRGRERERETKHKGDADD